VSFKRLSFPYFPNHACMHRSIRSLNWLWCQFVFSTFRALFNPPSAVILVLLLPLTSFDLMPFHFQVFFISMVFTMIWRILHTSTGLWGVTLWGVTSHAAAALRNLREWMQPNSVHSSPCFWCVIAKAAAAGSVSAAWSTAGTEADEPSVASQSCDHHNSWYDEPKKITFSFRSRAPSSQESKNKVRLYLFVNNNTNSKRVDRIVNSRCHHNRSLFCNYCYLEKQKVNTWNEFSVPMLSVKFVWDSADVHCCASRLNGRAKVIANQQWTSDTEG
jgi:hypothetical protein